MPIDIVSGSTTDQSTSAGSKHTKKSRQAKPAPNKSPGMKSTVTGATERGTQISQSNASKQEKIERLYLLPSSLDTTAERIMRITEQTSFDLDKLSVIYPNSFRTLSQGAGTGLVSLVLGALLSSLRHPNTTATLQTRILATDLPSAIELIEHNRAANEHLFRGLDDEQSQERGDQAPLIELRGVELDWEKPISDEIWDKDADSGAPCPFDIILMADVTYNTASFSALLDTVVALLNGPRTSSPSPIILLAYKCRDVAERTLWRDAAARGISFVQVDSVIGAREPAVEIWLGGWEKAMSCLWGEEQK
ncbi:hypothetical protein FRC07_014037 [Ceratobasidium sp. 392]|nr:hypothetical protein FRC07_014037 [Ceratobasidium sp. 392]